MPNFTLDTSTLGGSDFNYAENTIEGRGRSITIDWSQSGSDQDMELFGYSVRFFAAEEQPKESV